MNKITFFDKPAQVKFLDEEESVQYGIAYHDEIICACCGGIYEISEVSNIKELMWISFNDEIGE